MITLINRRETRRWRAGVIGKDTHQGDDDEHGSGDGSNNVGPHTRAVHEALEPAQILLEQRAMIIVEHDLEVPLQASNTPLAAPDSITTNCSANCCCIESVTRLLGGNCHTPATHSANRTISTTWWVVDEWLVQNNAACILQTILAHILHKGHTHKPQNRH